jgi:predicted RNA-binding protein with PUA-like domain
MNLWLFKQEPEDFSYADLEAAGKTLWDGVGNPLALKYLRQISKGDKVYFYHTGKEKAVVGEMLVSAGPQKDSNSDNEKAVVVEVVPSKRLKNPVSLIQIKADSSFSDWELVRIPRLSVMPVTKAQWNRIQELSKEIL